MSSSVLSNSSASLRDEYSLQKLSISMYSTYSLLHGDETYRVDLLRVHNHHLQELTEGRHHALLHIHRIAYNYV